MKLIKLICLKILNFNSNILKKNEKKKFQKLPCNVATCTSSPQSLGFLSIPLSSRFAWKNQTTELRQFTSAAFMMQILRIISGILRTHILFLCKLFSSLARLRVYLQFSTWFYFPRCIAMHISSIQEIVE